MKMFKDAYYFPHDSNAKDDIKCMSLIDQMGLEGYGVFWVLVETLREQPEFKYPLKMIPVLARRYGTSSEKMLTVIKNYDLFRFDGDKFFYSESLNRRMIPLLNSREQRRLAGIRSGEARRRKLNDRSTTVQQPFNETGTNYERSFNENEQSKVKESKVKESKEEKSKREDLRALSLSLINFFNFNEITNPDKLRDASRFVRTLSESGRLDFYREQFKFYPQYKEQSGEVVHGFKGFIGTPGEDYEDGGWNARNYKKACEIKEAYPHRAPESLRKSLGLAI